MSDETKPTRRFLAEPSGIPNAVWLGLLGLGLGAGGGAGSIATGNSVASELREFRVEMRGELNGLKATLADRDRVTERLATQVETLREEVTKIKLDLASRRGG